MTTIRQAKHIIKSMTDQQKADTLKLIRIKELCAEISGEQFNTEQLDTISKLLKGEPVVEVKTKPKAKNGKLKISKIKMDKAAWDK